MVRLAKALILIVALVSLVALFIITFMSGHPVTRFQFTKFCVAAGTVAILTTWLGRNNFN